MKQSFGEKLKALFSKGSSINEEFYEDTDMSDWRENHCYYDKEEESLFAQPLQLYQQKEQDMLSLIQACWSSFASSE